MALQGRLAFQSSIKSVVSLSPLHWTQWIFIVMAASMLLLQGGPNDAAQQQQRGGEAAGPAGGPQQGAGVALSPPLWIYGLPRDV